MNPTGSDWDAIKVQVHVKAGVPILSKESVCLVLINIY